MLNATELTLTTKALVDDGTARLYVGPLDEVVIWRDTRTGRMQHAQPTEYLVQDTDGYVRRFSAEDFAALFEAAPTPDDVTGEGVTTQNDASITLEWTDNGDADAVNIYRDGVLIVTQDGGTESYVDDPEGGLAANTAYTYVLKTVNSYGQESDGVEIDAFTAPVAPVSVTEITHGIDVIVVTIALGDATAKTKVYEGPNLLVTLDPGVTEAALTGLDPSTAYDITASHLGADSDLEGEATSPAVTITTNDLPS